MKRIYIAGPMTGLPELNFPAFHAAAAALRAQGHHVENPAEINADPKAQWLDCMRMDIARLVMCDAVYMLPGWQNSRGALVEYGLAVGLGLQVLHARGPFARDWRRTMVKCDTMRGAPVHARGWVLDCGAVLHRSPLDGRRGREFCDDAWTVSDPKSGAAMARGDGMAQAVGAYRDLVRSHGDAWAAVVAEKRKAYMTQRPQMQAWAGKKKGGAK